MILRATLIAVSIFSVVVVLLWVGMFLIHVLNPDHGDRRVLVELDQLTTALQSYKEKRTSLPPSLSERNSTERRSRFMRHVLTAFINANYGTAESNYLDLRTALMNENANSYTAQPYNFKTSDGALKPLDIDTLDQAEALVFWLGGFPTPFKPENGEPVSHRRLFGFHRDQDAPFKRDHLGQEGAEPMRNRTDPFYQFDETRLVDNDDDGWLEYLPMAQNGDRKSAPFVYFDAESYQTGTLGDVFYPADESLAALWGRAVPYVKSFDPAKPERTIWRNSDSFQIVCAGLDDRYGPPVGAGQTKARLIVWPEGKVFASADGKTFAPTELADEEEDDLSNLDYRTLGEAIKRAK